MYFAVLSNMNFVTNLIAADSKEVAEELTQATCIEVPESGVDLGWQWNGSAFEPYVPAPADGPSVPL